MKLTLTQTQSTKRPLASTYTRIKFVKKRTERFVEIDGVTTLELVIGKPEKITPRTFRTLIRSIVQSAKKHKVEKFAFDFDFTKYSKLSVYGEAWAYQTIAENLALANYEFNRYKSGTSKEVLKEILVISNVSKEAKTGFIRGETIATAVNETRDIANTPGGDMTPKHLAEAAKQALKGTKALVSVLDEPAIKKLGMGGLIGVGKGAHEKPKFIIIEYWGAGKPKIQKTTNDKKVKATAQSPLVFVGKGITFDTGGLQVKPGMSMYEMHMDMSGGAAVIGAITAIAKMGLKKNVIGLIPAAENAISDEAIRPGDVLTMMSGKTVDVLHTDAEGRLVLADALHYARRYNPRLVVDIATLTGASLVAVGQHAHVIMTKNRALEDSLRELGEVSGDYVFPLPLWDEFKQYTKGVHGDIANIPAGDSKYGGTINGGTFLSHFTKGLKWVHIDMTPRMTSVGSDKLAKGATGEPVRLLVTIAETL